jgi:hypothetical protein
LAIYFRQTLPLLLQKTKNITTYRGRIFVQRKDASGDQAQRRASEYTQHALSPGADDVFPMRLASLPKQRKKIICPGASLFPLLY